MVRTLKNSLIFTSCFVLLMSGIVSDAKTTKPLTMEERQEQLMSNINQAQGNHELTTKEARSLRSQLADLAHKKAKIKQKKTTLSPEDIQKLDTGLNNISVSINKLKLEKREHPEEQAKAAQKATQKK